MGLAGFIGFLAFVSLCLVFCGRNTISLVIAILKTGA
jgi:hypothetical protein